ncbi:hypothetical protein CWC11_21405 [Pseudoalteromonas sp. S3178]|nr:hypothetical protein CWC11_21405 [Pseudoalteromonas sp. S3178]
MCCGRTPLETLLDGKSIWAEKNLNAKLHKSNKPRYVSKADRAKQVDNTTTQDSTSIELTE